MQPDGRRQADGQKRDHPAPHQQDDAGRKADAEEMSGQRGDRIHQCGHAAGSNDDQSEVGNRKQGQRQASAWERPPDPRMRGTQDLIPHPKNRCTKPFTER
jgi:hypothetical protein